MSRGGYERWLGGLSTDIGRLPLLPGAARGTSAPARWPRASPSGEIARAQEFLSDPRGAADPGLRGGLQEALLAEDHDGAAAPSQRGVEELACQERQIRLREHEPDVVVFRTLGLMHRDG